MADPRSPRARRPGGRQRPRRTAPDLPRLAAYEVLRAVSAEDAYANLLLPARLRAHGLSGRDAAFVTELVSGTLRRQGTYDAVVAACLDRPPSRLDPGVLDVLRLGAHQLLGMRVSTHAAVSTSVDLTRAAIGPGPAGLVNAVLRRVSAQDLPTWVRAVAPDPVTDPVGFASVAQAHPRWVVTAFTEALGDRADELDDLLVADNRPPAVTLVARPGPERSRGAAERRGHRADRRVTVGRADGRGRPGLRPGGRRGEGGRAGRGVAAGGARPEPRRGVRT